MSIWEMCVGQRFSRSHDHASPVVLREELKKDIKVLIKRCKEREPVARWTVQDIVSDLTT